MLFATALLILVLICLVCTVQLKAKSKSQLLLPPGPRPLPVLGNILQVKPRELLVSLKKFQKKYGPIFTVYFGSRPAVMLCGYEVVKEALVDNKDVFSGRGTMPLAKYVLKGYGITGSSGQRWKIMRRFALTTLRNFGMGKRSIEERIQEEAQFLMEEFVRTKGKMFDPTFLLGCAVSNIICSIVFGKRFSYNDERFLSLLSNITGGLRFMNSGWGMELGQHVAICIALTIGVQQWGSEQDVMTFCTPTFGPRVGRDDQEPQIEKQRCKKIFYYFHGILNHIPGPHQKGFQHFTDIKTFVHERVDESLKVLNVDSPQHFIDCFLIKMQQEKENPDTEFHKENLVGSTMNLFFAGTETTNTTLRYGFLILLKYPEIQAKIQQEIDHVIGHHHPSADDRNKMPYTEAVIHEIQRFSDIVPTGLPHSTTEDVLFRGYFIPKGTDVFPVLTTVLQDPDQFPCPKVFSPERFLDDKGAIKKHIALMPFSAGKRMCPGEGLARMELFLFLTTLLQKFTLTTSMSTDDLDLTAEFSSAGHLPRYYEMSVIPRQ